MSDLSDKNFDRACDLIDRIVKENAALRTALDGILATFKSHVDGRDLLDELHPRKTIDIKVRVDARERWHEGDWLSNTRDAVMIARNIIAAFPSDQLGGGQ